MPGLIDASRWRRPCMTETSLPEKSTGQHAMRQPVRAGCWTLTDLEIAVFGSSPNPDTIELFRFRTEHAQRLLVRLYPDCFPQPRKRIPRTAMPGGLLTPAQAAAKLGCSIKTLNSHIKA